MDSNGIFQNSIDKKLVEIVRSDCMRYLSENLDIKNYSSEISNYSSNINLLLNSFIYGQVSKLLKVKKPLLCATELHIQRARCIPIPPHQDNFYHCIEYNKGLKILIPLQNLSSNNGGLTFIDTKYDFPVLDHSPSSIRNFSAYINKDTFCKIKGKRISYDLNVGDSTYHFLNSIHFSLGNQTSEDILFLIYRFQNPEAIVNKLAQTKYETCYEIYSKNIKNL